MSRYAVSVLLLLGTSARAQNAPEMVDADLLYTFAGIEDASALTIGEAPPRLSRVFPSGTRILGALNKTPSGETGARAGRHSRREAVRRSASESRCTRNA